MTLYHTVDHGGNRTLNKGVDIYFVLIWIFLRYSCISSSINFITGINHCICFISLYCSNSVKPIRS